jgi:hypothetical protein
VLWRTAFAPGVEDRRTFGTSVSPSSNCSAVTVAWFRARLGPSIGIAAFSRFESHLELFPCCFINRVEADESCRRRQCTFAPNGAGPGFQSSVLTGMLGTNGRAPRTRRAARRTCSTLLIGAASTFATGDKTDHADLRLYDALPRLRTFRGYLPVRHHAHPYHLPRAFNIEPNMCWECYSCVKAFPQLIPPRVMGSFTRTNALDPSGNRHNVTSSGEGKRQCQTIPLITTTTSVFMERT